MLNLKYNLWQKIKMNELIKKFIIFIYLYTDKINLIMTKYVGT